MKATIELPDALLREIKLKSVREGRKLKETVADLLRKGLSAETTPPARRRAKPSFPAVECRHTALANREMTPERVADVLGAQDVAWHAKARR